MPWNSEFGSQAAPWLLAANILFRLTVVLAAGCLIGLVLRRRSAAVRHAWWLMTLSAAAAVPLAFLILPTWGPATTLLIPIDESPSIDSESNPDVARATGIPAGPPTVAPTATKDAVTIPAVRTRASSRETLTTEMSPQGSNRRHLQRRARMTERLPVAEFVPTQAPAGTPSAIAARGRLAPRQRTSRILAILAVIWCVGGTLITFRVVLGTYRLRQIRRDAVAVTDQTWRILLLKVMAALRLRRPLALQQSSEPIGPLTGGLWRPFVLLPSGCGTWSSDRKRVVLLHEVAHAKRHDVLVLWWSRCVAALLWFHPLVWLVMRQLRIERERACDDLVLATGTRPSTYSQHLLAIAASSRVSYWPAAMSMAMAGPSQLEDRVRRVLDETRDRRSMAARSAAWLVLLMIGFATTIATAGRVVIRNADGATVATLNLPAGGSVTVETDPKPDRSHNWPQLGGSSQRNNVSPATQLPTAWDVPSSLNIRWTVKLGSQSFGTPVIADGKIFVGTNNGHGYIDRYPKQTDLGCLLCFDANTGDFLWQHSNEKLPTGRVHDWPFQGIASTPVVVAGRLYYVTNRAVVSCLDVNGLSDGDAGPVVDAGASPQEADVIWQFDLMRELGVSPKAMSGCSPTTDGKRLFVVTSNGTGENNIDTPNPNAPSFVCLDLQTGQLLWSARDAFAARDCQWSGPSLGTFRDAQGRPQTHVIFPGSDGWLYGYDPQGDGQGRPRLLWKFDCNPKSSRYQLGGHGRRNLHVSMPVVHGERVFVATGRNPEAGEGPADLWCIDPAGHTDGTDISEFLGHDANGQPLAVAIDTQFDASLGHKLIANPDSAVVWHYAAEDLDADGQHDFEETFHRSWGSPVIRDGLLVVADFSGLVHCLDVDSGKPFWTYDLLASCWASPLIADGKIFVADEDGEIAILELDQQLNLLAEVECGDSIYTTPIAAGSTLYVATRRSLLAIETANEPLGQQANRNSTAPGDFEPVELRRNEPQSLTTASPAGDPIDSSPDARPDIGSPNAPKPAGLSATAWKAGRNDAAQTGVATSSLPDPLHLRWKLPAADGWVAAAAIVGNHVYAASRSGDLYCLKLQSGEVVWKYRSVDTLQPTQFAPGFTSAPHVTVNAVYVGDEDGVLHAVDRTTGDRNWVWATAGEIAGSPAISGQRIVTASHDSFVYCLDTDGQLLWKFRTADRINCSPAIADQHVIISGCDEHVRVLDLETGRQIQDIPLNAYLIASPAVLGEQLFVGTYASEVVALNWRTGQIDWRYRDDTREFPYHASASVTASHVFVGGHDKRFHCIDRVHGEAVWKFATRAKINSSSAVVGDRVFFGSDDGNLYGLRISDGHLQWRFRAGQKISAGIAVGEGFLVVGADAPNGDLYCFGRRD